MVRMIILNYWSKKRLIEHRVRMSPPSPPVLATIPNRGIKARMQESIITAAPVISGDSLQRDIDLLLDKMGADPAEPIKDIVARGR